jgi:hypothetical protein
MGQQMSAAFVSHASEILADTSVGLSGPQIVRLCTAYAVEWGIDIPYDSYPFVQNVANKRTALYQNLMAFSEAHRYKIIRELCDYPAVRQRNGQAAEKLKQMLIARYGHLADEQLGSEIDSVLIERTQHWLGPFPDALKLYDGAMQKHANGVFLRNVLDDLRLALEILLKAILGNKKPLEKQIPLARRLHKEAQRFVGTGEHVREAR